MKKIIVFLLFLSHHSIGQQRIGIDLSTRMSNLNLTVHYQKVLKGNLLVSGGVFYGSMGQGYHHGDTLHILSGFPVHAPYPNVNEPIQDSTGTSSLIEYIQKGRVGGVQLGLGYFHEFGVQHGLRFNVNARLGYAQQKTTGYYWNPASRNVLAKGYYNGHVFGGISTEVYHTIRTSGRFTFLLRSESPLLFYVGQKYF